MELSASQKEWRDQVCAFAQEMVAPQAGTWDQQERTSEEAIRLFDRLEKEGVHLFYVKTPVEFGVLGREQ